MSMWEKISQPFSEKFSDTFIEIFLGMNVGKAIELIPQAFDDPGYDDVHWTLESIVTDLQSEEKTFYQIFRLDVLLEEFITYLEDWESETGVDTTVDDIRDSINGIVDDIVEYATWNETDKEIITAVSNITEYLVDAMDSIPQLDNLFDPDVVSPINNTLAAMMEYAVDAGSYLDVVSATENLINELGSLLDSGDDCASEAAQIESYIDNYINTTLMFNETMPLDELVVEVVNLAEDAVAFVNSSGRDAVILVYNESTSGWSKTYVPFKNVLSH